MLRAVAGNLTTGMCSMHSPKGPSNAFPKGSKYQNSSYSGTKSIYYIYINIYIYILSLKPLSPKSTPRAHSPDSERLGRLNHFPYHFCGFLLVLVVPCKLHPILKPHYYMMK